MERLENGDLAWLVPRKFIAFSSPLARCMETTLRMLTNQTGLRVAGDLVTVSELLRERIDARVPFELRRPVSFVPDVVIKAEAAEAAAEAAKKNGAAELSGQGGARGPGGRGARGPMGPGPVGPAGPGPWARGL